MIKDNSHNVKVQDVSATGKIDPSRNFLLRKAERLSETSSYAGTKILYRLHNGILAVYSRPTNPLVPEKLERVDLISAESQFNVKL